MLDAPLPESTRELLAREERSGYDGWVLPARPACGGGGYRGLSLRRRNRWIRGPRAMPQPLACGERPWSTCVALRRARGGFIR